MKVRAFAGILIFAAIGFGQAPSRLSAIYASPAARAASEEFSKKKEVAIKAQQDLEKILVQAKRGETFRTRTSGSPASIRTSINSRRRVVVQRLGRELAAAHRYRQIGPRRGQRIRMLARGGVHTFPAVTFDGFDLESHFLAERFRKKAAHGVGLPAGGFHQFGQARALGFF